MAEPYNIDELTQDPFLRLVVKPESGGQNIANVPLPGATPSSAFGLFQITKPTFDHIVTTNPNLQGLSYDVFQKDPKAQVSVAEALAKSHRATLASHGLEDNPTNMYGMWFGGSGGGPALLKADENTPMTSVWGQNEIASNPWVGKLTAGELRKNLSSKVGTQYSSMATATTSDVNPVGISSMSNEQLLKLATPSAPKGLEGLSNEELLGMAKGQPPSAQAPQGPMGGADVAFQAITNIPSSAAKFAGDIYQAVTNPVETVKSIGMLGAGAIKNALPKSVTDFITSISSEPGQIDKAVEMANAVGGEYAKKYGSLEGFKTAIATDPVGTAADISMMFTGGGSLVGKLPGIVGSAGETVANVGRTIDPLNIAVKSVTKPLQLAEMLATPAVGLATGAGAESIREGARAGAAGGAKAEAFLGQLRGNAPIENVVSTAKEAVAELYRNKSDAYKSGMTGVTQNRALLDFAPIDQAIINAEKVGTFNGVVIRGNAASALKEIKDKVAEFKAGNPAVFRTVEGFDKLKQAIGDIQQALPYGTPARKVADDLYNSVKNEIVKQAPDYAKVMGDYEQASALLKDIEGSLSLGKKANIDTSVRKLQSILRNNANTNYGRRVDLGRQLEATGVPGADTLFPQLAGQMLSSPTPRGIQGATTALGGAAAYATNPSLLPGLALTSPRLVGEAAYYGGKAGGAAQRVAEALKSYTGKLPIDPYTLRMLAAKLGQMQPEEQRQ
jgi:hypothetical protein